MPRARAFKGHSGKASGKTRGLKPIWPGVVPEEHQNCCSYTPDLVKRIAELEAVANEQARMIEWYREKVKKAEAELAATQKRANEWAWDAGENRGWKARAEKAEAEVERVRIERDGRERTIYKMDREIMSTRQDRDARIRELHSLADIALDQGCDCEPNGESCPGHAFLELWKLTVNPSGEPFGRKERDDG